jgi:hypothetical protein
MRQSAPGGLRDDQAHVGNVLLMEAVAVIVVGFLITGASGLCLRNRIRLGELASKYASPTLDGPTYASICKIIGWSGIAIGALWIAAGLAHL